MAIASYRRVDYSTRPGKYAERKMFSEFVGCLHKFHQLNKYQYIGFGSIWFADISLIHKQHGINRMISIEKELGQKERFDFNKPYGHIEMHYGNSSEILPTLDWRIPTIAWLDYDDQLSMDIVSDLRLYVDKCKSGDVLFVTVQAKSKPLIEIEGEKREIEDINEFRSIFGETICAPTFNNSDLRGNKLSFLYRQTLILTINEMLERRNGGLPRNRKLAFKTEMVFNYDDGCPMTSIGGVFVEASDEVKYKECNFKRLSFNCNKIEEPISIKVPYLTQREMRFVEQHLPKKFNSKKFGFLPSSDIDAFRNFYRYLPSFASFEP